MQHKKYRLRWNSEIVGYAEETSEGILYKGKEWLWWMRGKPRYNQIDEAIFLKDKMHRDIYEWDIVLFHLDSVRNPVKAIVLWQEQFSQFVLYEYENDRIFPIFVKELSLFENDKLEIVSHLFTQKELMKNLNFKNK